MSSTNLSVRALNRALLARQILLQREKKTTALAAIERLVAMQAQVPRPPFVGLWSRLDEFEAAALRKLLHDKKVVRATAMRGTIHLLSARDFLAFRPTLAPMLVKGAASILRDRMAGVELETVYALGRKLFNTPAPFEDLRDLLVREMPDLDTRALAYSVRMGVPLVMVPTESAWAFPANAGFVLAEKWLGAKLPAGGGIDALVLRYLAAFGPATPGDFQTWSGMSGARETFEKLRPKLVTFRDERKRELFDLPDAPRPDEDAPAPVRFLPEFDNILLGHDDRRRIIADDHRKRVFLKNLQVLGTFLVDGFVAGIWRVERAKKLATLALKPFLALDKKSAAALEREGARLIEFLEPDIQSRDVHLLPRGLSFT